MDKSLYARGKIMEENKNNSTVWIIGIVVALCCIAVIAIPLGGYLYATLTGSHPLPDQQIPPVQDGTATSVPELTRPPVDATSTETLDKLETTIVPSNDLRDLVCRLKGICNVP